MGLFKSKDKKAKVVVKTAKGRGLIRKVKVSIGVSVIGLVMVPVVQYVTEQLLGATLEPEQIQNISSQLSELALVAYGSVIAIVAAYRAQPAPEDGVEIVE